MPGCQLVFLFSSAGNKISGSGIELALFGIFAKGQFDTNPLIRL